MVTRSFVIALMLAAAGSSVVTAGVIRLATPSSECARLSPADPEQQRKAADFFRSIAPPTTGGQEMKPRW